jgi:hypothetical protein
VEPLAAACLPCRRRSQLVAKWSLAPSPSSAPCSPPPPNSPPPRSGPPHTGALGGIALWRYVTIVRPPTPWPTGSMGPAFVGLVAAGVAVPTALMWLGALAVWRLGQRRRRRQGSCGGGGGGSGGGGGGGGGGAHAAAAAALAATVAAGAVGRLQPAIAAWAASGSGGGGKDKAAAAAAALELRLPLADSEVGSEAGAEAAVPVEAGRPALEAALDAWLSGLGSGGSGGSATAAADQGGCGAATLARLRVDVFGMGPPGVVAAAHAACDTLSWGHGQRRHAAASLRFVAKTQAL